MGGFVDALLVYLNFMDDMRIPSDYLNVRKLNIKEKNINFLVLKRYNKMIGNEI